MIEHDELLNVELFTYAYMGEILSSTDRLQLDEEKR